MVGYEEEGMYVVNPDLLALINHDKQGLKGGTCIEEIDMIKMNEFDRHPLMSTKAGFDWEIRGKTLSLTWR